MTVRAKCAFAGQVSMAAGEVRDIPEGAFLSGLIASDYVEPVKTGKNKKNTTESEVMTGEAE
jgi:hypothetical protein